MSQTILKFKYEEVIKIWESFYQLHSNLYDLTCDEYLLLLSSEIENLEETIAAKDEILNQIGLVENSRQALIEDINNKKISDHTIDSVSDLISVMRVVENNSKESRLEKLNLLLIDVIEKIQEQNKKNQQFLNKAILSLQHIREGFSGEKQYKTYEANGMASNNMNR